MGNTLVEFNVKELKVVNEGKSLLVSGETNLPDGVNLIYDLSPEDEKYDVDIYEGNIPVEGKKFSIKLDISQFKEGIKLNVWVAFAPLRYRDDQLEETYERYGEYGSKITSKRIVWSTSDGLVKNVGIEKQIEL